MYYKILIIFIFFLSSCTSPLIEIKNVPDKKNRIMYLQTKGFGLMYDDNLYKNKRRFLKKLMIDL